MDVTPYYGCIAVRNLTSVLAALHLELFLLVVFPGNVKVLVFVASYQQERERERARRQEDIPMEGKKKSTFMLKHSS